MPKDKSYLHDYYKKGKVCILSDHTYLLTENGYAVQRAANGKWGKECYVLTWLFRAAKSFWKLNDILKAIEHLYYMICKV